MTVKELYACCANQIEKGNGDLPILISNDDEGNGYHELYYEFMDDKDDLKAATEWCGMPYGFEEKEFVILG